MEPFPAFVQARLQRVLPFVVNPPGSSFSLVLPPIVPSTSGAPPSSEGTFKEVHVDPWRLLEDYPDTPLCVSSFGGYKVNYCALFADVCMYALMHFRSRRRL